jgi:hypothetical protein
MLVDHVRRRGGACPEASNGLERRRFRGATSRWLRAHLVSFRFGSISGEVPMSSSNAGLFPRRPIQDCECFTSGFRGCSIDGSRRSVLSKTSRTTSKSSGDSGSNPSDRGGGGLLATCGRRILRQEALDWSVGPRRLAPVPSLVSHRDWLSTERCDSGRPCCVRRNSTGGAFAVMVAREEVL